MTIDTETRETLLEQAATNVRGETVTGDVLQLPDVNDVVEIVALDASCPYQSLKPGMTGKVIAVCDNYCLWVDFPEANQDEKSSQQFGFAIYFDEVVKQ